MILFRKIRNLREYLAAQRKNKLSVGLVPTMGALHDGHLSLIRRAQEENDLTVCTIFVNPAQFNQSNDLEQYPKQESKDFELLKQIGCTMVFAPSVDEMYPTQMETQFRFGKIAQLLEGMHRPGHFSGVGLVISKLFNIVDADRAYFGQKDVQQIAVIKQIARDLNFSTTVVAVPTLRIASGLAMSSRNLRLSTEELTIAANLYRVMKKAQALLLKNNNIQGILTQAKDELNSIEGFKVEYFEVVDTYTMENVSSLHLANEVSICGAAYVGQVRIIDNLCVKRKK